MTFIIPRHLLSLCVCIDCSCYTLLLSFKKALTLCASVVYIDTLSVVLSSLSITVCSFSYQSKPLKHSSMPALFLFFLPVHKFKRYFCLYSCLFLCYAFKSAHYFVALGFGMISVEADVALARFYLRHPSAWLRDSLFVRGSRRCVYVILRVLSAWDCPSNATLVSRGVPFFLFPLVFFSSFD